MCCPRQGHCWALKLEDPQSLQPQTSEDISSGARREGLHPVNLTSGEAPRCPTKSIYHVPCRDLLGPFSPQSSIDVLRMPNPPVTADYARKCQARGSVKGKCWNGIDPPSCVPSQYRVIRPRSPLQGRKGRVCLCSHPVKVPALLMLRMPSWLSVLFLEVPRSPYRDIRRMCFPKGIFSQRG